MRPLYVEVRLFDPLTDELFPVSEGIEVEVARFDPSQGGLLLDPLRLQPPSDSRIFHVHAPNYKAGRRHYLQVRFLRASFSKSSGALLGPDEAARASETLFCPSRLPAWDSGWDDDYRRNEHFSWRDLRMDTSPERPLVLKVPLRRIYCIGHRGSPQEYPENTIASFRAALNRGANGLEFDLCITKDRRLLVFHDPTPEGLKGLLDRTRYEHFPYELVSPEFVVEGGITYARVRELRGGGYAEVARRPLASRDEYDLVNLTRDEVRRIYRYQHVHGVEHAIPDFEELLALAREQAPRLHFLFFDVKNPDWDERKDAAGFVEFGRLIGVALRQYTPLPDRLVICNASPRVLGHLKAGVGQAGETRCVFAYDASGGLSALLGVSRTRWAWLPSWLRWIPERIFGTRENPLRVARRMQNPVVSIGSLLRPGHLDEIREAVRDRDYKPRSPVETVIHWTVNDRAKMYQSLSAGVNGIVTDDLGELLDTLRSLRIAQR